MLTDFTQAVLQKYILELVTLFNFHANLMSADVTLINGLFPTGQYESPYIDDVVAGCNKEGNFKMAVKLNTNKLALTGEQYLRIKFTTTKNKHEWRSLLHKDWDYTLPFEFKSTINIPKFGKDREFKVEIWVEGLAPGLNTVPITVVGRCAGKRETERERQRERERESHLCGGLLLHATKQGVQSGGRGGGLPGGNGYVDASLSNGEGPRSKFEPEDGQTDGQKWPKNLG